MVIVFLLSIVVVVSPIFLFFNDADSDTKEGGAGAACPMARCMNFKEEMRDDSGFVMGGTGPVVSGGVGGGITPNDGMNQLPARGKGKGTERNRGCCPRGLGLGLVGSPHAYGTGLRPRRG